MNTLTDESPTTVTRSPGRLPALVVGGRDVTGPVAIAVVLVALVVFASVTTDNFATERNLVNVMKQMVTTGLLAYGMLVVILTAGIDLSVGSIVAFAGIVCAGLASDLPIWMAVIVGVLAGIGFGAINGILIAGFDLAPFVVTLASLTTIRGLAYVYSEVPIAPEDPGFLALGSETIGVIPVSALIMLAVFIVGGVFLTFTPPGRAIIAIGGNRETVRLAGIGVRKHIVLAYMISGACAGLAGVILTSRVGIAQPSVGVAFELDAIAACVIGGARLSGGRGTVKGMVAGVVVLSLINNMLNLHGVQSFWQQVLKGLIIIAVILVHSRSQRRSRRT